MKGLKKAVSVIGALAMTMSVLGAVPAVQAEDSEIYGWARNMANTETRYAEIVREDGDVKPATGERMLKIEGVTKDNIRVYIPEKLKAGKYTVSFKAYINYGKYQQWLATAKLGFHSLTGIDGQNGSIANITSTSTDNKSAMWREYTAEYEIKSDTDGTDGKIGTNNLNFGLKDIAEKDGSVVYYIDDVSVTDTDGNEYVTNGGFEEDAPIVVPDPDPDIITEDIEGWARLGENTATRNIGVVTSGQMWDGTAVTPASGERMLEVKAGEEENAQVYVPTKLKAGTYKISFKVYWNTGGAWVTGARLGTKHLGTDSSNGAFERIGATGQSTVKGTRETLQNGWIKFTDEITLSSDTDGIASETKSNNLRIYFTASKCSKKTMYIDDVSVTDADGNEYVTNGGFEQVSPMAFSDYTLTINGSDTATVTDGDATAKVTVKNNNTSAIDVQIIIASYAADNSLINVEASDIRTIDGGETKVVYTTVPLAVGNDAAKVKVFLWDSLDEMTPLKDMQEYTR